jgi:GNAT superfamily N-acetyltransferase
MADQNPFSEFGGELKAKVSSDNPFSEFGGELKKKEPTSLGFSVTPLPSQDKFQQGLKFAQQGFKMPSADVQRQKKEQGYLLNTVSSLDRGFYKNLVGNPVKGLGTLLQGTTAKVLGGSGKGFVSEALIDFGDYFNKTIDELAPQDEEFKNSLTDQFAQAFGQVGSLVLTAGAGGVGKGASMATQLAPKAAGKAAAARGLAAELTSPTSISAGLSMGQAEFEKAKQFGASDEDAFEVFYKNAAVGSVLEKIPTMQFLKRFNQATSGGIANYIKTKGVAGITGGLEEMTTEVLQQIYANKTAKDVYNINQNIFEDLTSSGGIGFGVGFLLNAMGAKARLLKRDGKTSEAKQIQDQIQQFESKIEDDNKKGQDEKIKVNNIVDKIEKGELVPLEDIEFYEANKNKIDKAIQAKQLEAELSAPSVIMPEENVAPEIIEPTRPAVIMPEENVPVETTVVRPEQQGKAPSVIMPEANVAPEVAETVVTEEVKPTEVKPTEEANYNVIAADYLFTGGKGVILSTDYFLQALTASFPYSSEKINEIRNRYANKFGNIKDDIGTDSYNSAINEIKDEINKTYNNEKASELFDKIVNNSTGFTLSREGNKVSSELEKLNEEFKPTETKAEVKPTEVKPEVKSKLEAFKSKFAPQPKQLSLKGIGAAETRKINEEAKKVEPKDARGFALSWLATGDESVSPDSLNKLLGSFRASLNVGKVKKTQEERLRDYVDKEGEDIDKVADKIWDRLPEQMQDKFTSMDVRDQLEMLIAEYPTRKDAAAALVEYGTGEQGVEEQQARYEEGKGVSETQEEAPIEIKGGFVPIEEDIDAKSLSKNIEDKYNVKLDLFETDKDISLSKIVVPKETRGKGIGTSAMEEIINYADINNKRILLTPSTDFGGTSVDRLKEFYKGFGFVENKGKNKDFTTKETMYRNPIQVEETPFAIEEVTSEEVNQMQDIVKDYINEGITSLPEIKKAIAKELGYNTRKLRQTIDDAYNKYTATKEAAPVEVTSGVVGRIGNALKKMFGKDAQKPFVAKDSKALEAKLSDIKDDVRFQIEAGFRGANDMPVAYRYDTDQVARERFDIPKLKKIGEGSDRVVFDLKDGKVLKIAKTPRGLEQNIYEGDYYLSGTILPETFERGLNYVVVEKISPAITRTIDLGIADINIESDKKGIGKLNDLLKKLKQFTQKDFDNHNGDLQDILAEYDLTDIMNYDVIWNDFTAKRNWGLKDGEPLHLDGGTFGGIQMLDRFKGQKPLSDPEFRDIYNKSKKAKIENKDVDKFTKFMATPDADILGFTYQNKMYLNGEKLNPNTPIHEAGHIWVEWTKTNDPKIYAKGMELVEGSPYLKKAKESKFYQQQAENMTDAEKTDYFKNEALAMAIGDKGAQFVVESKRESFKDWLKTLWTKIKSLTGFKDLTEEEFQNLTFEEFSKMAVKEILGVENDLDQFQAARSMKKKKEFVKGKVRGEANKRAIDDFEVDDMIKLIKADYDLQTLKNIKDAIQKRSAEEVLPSQPRKIGERRGERKRVEPRVEGDEAAGEGEATPTEDVEKEWQGAITIAANEERRQMLGLPEYQREKQSFEEWTNKAIKMIKRGYNVEKLLDKMEKGNYSPTPEENQIRKIYVAKLKSDYDANPTPELEKKLIRYTQLNDIVNSQLGRQLRSLADVTEPRETLADFVISKMEANNVDELTEKQRKQVEKQYEEIKKKEEDVEAKLEINDELNAQLLAETVFKEEKAKRKPYQKTKDYKADRKSIIESIKQKWKDKDKPSDVLMALPFPVPTKKAQQLVAIAPDVSKLMASYIEEGVDDLKEIVSRIYVDLRNEIDGLSEKDIFDVIAGRYKKEKPLLTQLQLKKAELKKEAELIAKIEDIMAGNMPTNEKAKIEQNQRITQLRNELRDLKKEVGFYDLSKINSLKEKNLEKIKEIDEKIQKGDFEKAIKAPSFLENPEFRKKYPKEYEAYIQSAKELSDKKHEFEVSLAKDELKGLTFRDKLVKRWGPEFKNTLSAIKATLDNSFIFIQLGPAIWSNPLLLPKVLNEQRKVIFNEGRFKREIVQIFENKELANLIEVSGLDILDPQTLRESLREEQLGGTDFLERSVEIKGKKYSLATIIKAPFERIAIAAGNYVRLKLFLESVSHLEAQGKTIETHEKEFKDAARIANEMTARGELSEEFKTGKLKTLSSLTWAPKMIGSTINLLGLGDIYNYALGRKGYYASLSPELRKAAIGKMATAIAVPYLAMAALALDDDFEVDYDPRSVTFGQIKQISTGKSWNPYGRFTSVVRYLILMMLGVRYIGDEKLRADFKTETFKFFRGKMAPAYGLGLDLAFREGFDGQPLSFNDVAKDAITPLAIKDLKTYLEDDGTWGLITQGLPALSGIKVGTEKQYNQAKQPLEDIIKKHARTDDTYYSFELKNPSTKEIATKEQFDKFVKERDKLIAEKLTDLYNGYVITDSPNPVPFVSLEPNEAGKQISTAKTEATKEAKEIVFGKKKKTAMERLIERKRRLLRR